MFKKLLSWLWPFRKTTAQVAYEEPNHQELLKQLMIVAGLLDPDDPYNEYGRFTYAECFLEASRRLSGTSIVPSPQRGWGGLSIWFNENGECHITNMAFGDGSISVGGCLNKAPFAAKRKSPFPELCTKVTDKTPLKLNFEPMPTTEKDAARCAQISEVRMKATETRLGELARAICRDVMRSDVIGRPGSNV